MRCAKFFKFSKNVKEELLKKIEALWLQFWGKDPCQNDQYPKIINQKHFDRINQLIATSGTIACGGENSPENFKIAPTILEQINWDAPVMQEEIFGPVLPVLEFTELQEVIDVLSTKPKPLALYFFSNNKRDQEKIIHSLSYGGGCMNETIIHMVGHQMPFGGVGFSGMGQYHGEFSFQTFSHAKSILFKSNVYEPSIRYAPYTDKKFGLLKKLFR